MKKVSCIYSIINLKNNKKYIGSTIDLDSRIRQHLYKLRNNKHHSKYLQCSWNKHGEQNFIFHILEFCSKEKTLEIEQIYLISLNPEYNISKSSTAPMTGRKHKKETLIKFKKRKIWNKGVPRTKEEKSFISFRIKEAISKKSPEYNEQISIRTKKWISENGARFKGRHHTEENKKAARERTKSKKKIVCINNNEIFEAQLDIAKKYNIKQGHISEVLGGKREHVKGLYFRYENELTPVYRSHLVAVEDNNGNKFRTITELCKYYGFDRIKINNRFYHKDVIEYNGILIKRVNKNA